MRTTLLLLCITLGVTFSYEWSIRQSHVQPYWHHQLHCKYDCIHWSLLQGFVLGLRRKRQYFAPGSKCELRNLRPDSSKMHFESSLKYFKFGCPGSIPHISSLCVAPKALPPGEFQKEMALALKSSNSSSQCHLHIHPTRPKLPGNRSAFCHSSSC